MTLDLVCMLALFVITVTQIVLVGWFASICRRGAGPAPAGAPCLTPARVILCLRGSDPFLGDTIRAAVNQDHPDYELRVIIDSRDDPAWAEVEAALATARPRCRVVVEPLAHRPSTSSLKCASLIQGLGDAERGTAMVALLDADVVPAASWLRTLGTALAADGCGVATGNRWYAPPDRELGSWARAGWNAGALVQMVCFGIPWGGTLAVRSSLLESAGLRGKWARAFCEDTLLSAALAGTGWRVKFVPALIAVNHESVTLAALVPWITRQLLTARLYHPAWPVVAIFGLSAPLTVLATAVAIGLALARHDLPAGAGLGICLALFLASLPTLFLWIERIVMQTVGTPRLTATPALADAVRGTFSAQAIYGSAILRALALTSTRWRGATYTIGGPFDIRLVADDAAAGPGGPASGHSI